MKYPNRLKKKAKRIVTQYFFDTDTNEHCIVPFEGDILTIPKNHISVNQINELIQNIIKHKWSVVKLFTQEELANGEAEEYSKTLKEKLNLDASKMAYLYQKDLQWKLLIYEDEIEAF